MVKKILKDSFPTMIALTLSGMYSVIDGLFIGRSAGDTGLAAINIAWPVTAVITAFGLGVGTGGSVLFSYYKGAGNTEDEKRTYRSTWSMLFLGGVLLTLVFLGTYPHLLKGLGADGAVYTEAKKYSEVIIKGSLLQVMGAGVLPILRNKGRAMGAMFSMIAGLLVNISMNYYLMMVCGMGIQGAAYGTVTAQGGVLISAMGWMGKEKAAWLQFGIDIHKCKEILKIGVTAFGVSLAPSITLIFTNWQCLKYGGHEAVACYAVISYIIFPVQYLLSGIGDGVQPLMSYLNGAGKQAEVVSVKRIAMRMALGFGITAAMVSILFSSQIGIWFGLSAAAEVYFESGMKISALSFLLTGVTRLNITGLNATLQVRKAVLLTYTESLIVAPLLLYLIPAFAGMKGIWMSLPASALCMLLIYRFREEKDEKTMEI